MEPNNNDYYLKEIDIYENYFKKEKHSKMDKTKNSKKKYVSKIPLASSKTKNIYPSPSTNNKLYSSSINNNKIHITLNTSSSPSHLNSSQIKYNVNNNNDYFSIQNTYTLLKALIEKATCESDNENKVNDHDCNISINTSSNNNESSDNKLNTHTTITGKDDNLNFHESYIARKALYQWKEFTKNALKIRKAQKHYERTLKRKGLDAFLFQTHFIRKEWKLEIRADIHYKHSLLQKCLDGWKEFSHHQKLEKNILKKVDDFGKDIKKTRKKQKNKINNIKNMLNLKN